ncbi:MAG: hypothetical protein AAB343_02175 [Patescibacteria group bacterium]
MHTHTVPTTYTLLLPIFEGIEGKNLLRTGVMMHLLKHEDVRVVMLVKNQERLEYYRHEIQHERIQFIVHSGRAGKTDWREHTFEILRYYMLRSRTTTLRARMLSATKGGIVFYYYKLILHFLLARPFIRATIRRLDASINTGNFYQEILSSIRPNLVMIANQMDPDEVELIKEARRMGIRTVGYMNSWDKITARSAMRVLTDQYTVYNDVLVTQMERFQDVPPSRIRTVGLPQYDMYVRPEALHEVATFYGHQLPPYASRAVHGERIGCDPNDRIVLYSPIGSAFSNSDWDMIDLLHQFEVDARDVYAWKLFVRFPPNDVIQDDEIARRPWLRYEIPSKRFAKHRGGDWDMNFEQLQQLRETLSNAALVVCYASSFSIDAAILDIPVININFELRKNINPLRSPTFFYGTEHYRNAILTGGIQLAQSSHELRDLITATLRVPSTHHNGRMRLVREQCTYADGNSSQRVADALYQWICMQ